MADVTDPAFRRIIAKYGKPDVTWTEFVAGDGLVHPAGVERLKRDLEFAEIGDQLWRNFSQVSQSIWRRLRVSARSLALME